MKRIQYLILFFISFVFSAESWAARIGHSSEEWKQIRTEHFDIIFSAKQHDLGLYYAEKAEIAYNELSQIFSHPTERIVLVVNDTTDVANGFATPIPYPNIMAYTVPVGDHDSLSEAGEWGRELVTHELTHIMQLEPSLGFYRWIRPIFGSIVAPNLLMPLWWKEGMAVEMETQFSPQGRLRSHFQDATLRALSIENKLFDYTLPQANEVLPSWPYGSRPYLFGSLFWSSLVKNSQKKSIDHLVTRQAERVPYFIEEPMKELTNANYESQYSKALYESNENSLKQLEQLKKIPFTDFKLITLKPKSYYSLTPRWSAQNQTYGYLLHKDEDFEIIITDAQQKELNLKNRPSGAINSFDFFPNKKSLLYSKVDQPNSKYYLSDLYIYDLEKDKSEQLTFSERAREVNISDDGSAAVFITTLSGRTQIKKIDFDTKKITVLVEGNFKQRFQSPIFWKESTILYTSRDEKGQQTLHSYSLKNQTDSILNLSYKDMRFLRKKYIQGSPVLFFNSSENGVFNIYQTSDLKQAQAITHVPTGIWSYDIDLQDKKIWATLMTDHGFQVAETTYHPQKLSLPKINNALAERYEFKSAQALPKANWQPEDYSSGRYLIPRYWIPYIATSSSSNGVYLQAQTSGYDPLHIHDYAIQANYDSEIKKAGFTGFYTNSSTVLPTQISALVYNQVFGNSTNIVENQMAALSFLPDMFFLSKNLILQIGAEYQQTNYNESKTEHWGPYLLVNYQNYSQSLFQISPEKGLGLYLKYENLNNLFQSRDFNKVTTSVVGYANPWLPEHHALMGRLSALQTFETVPARFGTSNQSLFLNSDLNIPQFVLRGYQPSQFYGRSMWNINLEYRFPIKNIEKGSGTDAYFWKRLSAAITTDGLATEGGAVTEKNIFQKTTINQSYWSSGLEFKLESTIGYVLPMNFVLGLYLPYSPEYSSSVQTGLSLQIGGF